MNTNYAVIVLSYNHPDLTSRTVQSARELGVQDEIIFLIHNGSEPRFIEKLKSAFPNINHLAMEKNLGFSGGANFGLNEVFKKYERVLFLTNDVEVLNLPEKFPEDFDACSIHIEKRNTGDVDSVLGLLNLKNGRLEHLKNDLVLSAKESFKRFYIPGTAFGLKKETFLKLQGFDESLHTYWEDVDFSLRAQDLGFKIGCSPSFRIRHKIGKTCHKERFYTLYLFQRNRKRVLFKHSSFKLRFSLHYALDMVQLLGRLLRKPQRWSQLHFWWKAIYD